jgi:hypothetical protein
MTLTDHIDIELILIEAAAYNLRNEVQSRAIELMKKDLELLEVDAYTLAFKQTIALFNI